MCVVFWVLCSGVIGAVLMLTLRARWMRKRARQLSWYGSTLRVWREKVQSGVYGNVI